MSDGVTLQMPLDWRIPEGMQAPYATQLLVQPGEPAWILSFHEVRQPVLLGSDEEVRRAAKALGKVPAICVARVAVPAAEIPRMIAALQETWQKVQGQRTGGVYAIPLPASGGQFA